MSQSIPCNPIVMRWARESSHLGVEEVAKRINKNPSDIESWETGNTSPTYVQLERLAYKIYKRPIAIFFFPEPPEEEPLEKTFRTLPDHELRRMPAQMVYLLRKAKALQLNLIELYGKNYSADKRILVELDLSKQKEPNSIAEQVRSYIGISLKEQTKWKDIDVALKNWRNALEECGVFVFKDSFNASGKNSPKIAYSGFSIYDKAFPIIYVNNNDSKSRQIFTLFHELCHLLMHSGGVDTDNEDYLDYLAEDNRAIEILCNKFASLFLVPDFDFRERSKDVDVSNTTVSKLASYYCVSREVILRRFLEQGRVSQEKYRLKTEEWSQQKKQGSGGDYYRSIWTYLGDQYIETVFSHYHQGTISLEKTAEYLNQKPRNISGLEEILLGKQIS